MTTDNPARSNSCDRHALFTGLSEQSSVPFDLLLCGLVCPLSDAGKEGGQESGQEVCQEGGQEGGAKESSLDEGWQIRRRFSYAKGLLQGGLALPGSIVAGQDGPKLGTRANA